MGYKAYLRRQVRGDVAEFLAKGGTVDVIEAVDDTTAQRRNEMMRRHKFAKKKTSRPKDLPFRRR
jgi:hypothetical protein